MDTSVKRGDSDRSRSVSGDSVTSVSGRTNTPTPSTSRTPTPVATSATSDISVCEVELDPSHLSVEASGSEQEAHPARQEGTKQLKAMLGNLEKFFVLDSYKENGTHGGKFVHTILSDVEMDPFQLSEENGTEQEAQRKRQEGTKQLKAMLKTLGKFFVFDSYVKTENDTREGKFVHTGRARCQQEVCLAKLGKAATYTFTTRSKGNLKKHYEKMHSSILPSLRAAFDGASKRGRSKARDEEFSGNGGDQLCTEESNWQDSVTPEVLRQTCSRWFIDTMMPLSLIDHPTTRQFFSLLAPEFSLPSGRTLGRDIDQSLATVRSSTPTPSTSRTPTPLPMSDISLCKVELDPSLQSMEENGTGKEAQSQEGTKQLKAMLDDLEKFFVFDSYVKTENDTQEGKFVHTGRARCQHETCLAKGAKAATYTYTTRSKGNLKKHYEKMHSAMLQTIRTAFDGARKRARSKDTDDELPAKRGGHQLDTEESFSWDKVTPKVLRKTCTRWFIDTMMPLSLIDHPTTRHFLSLLAPDFSPPSRRTLGRDIEQASATAKSDLENKLHNTSFVATTVDSWMTHNRTFIGMTGHWIDLDLRRQHGTLACKEIKDKQTNVVVAQAIFDTHQEFGLVNKVVGITTANGANHVATFTHCTPGDSSMEREEEHYPEGGVGQSANLLGQLEEAASAALKLPKCYRCGAHTLNLIATSDVQSVAGWNQDLRAPFTKAAAKAQWTWNLQNGSSLVTNSIKEKIGRKLKTFCVTRWNSYYLAVQILMDVLSNPDKMRLLNEIISQGGVAMFDEMDKHVFSEYLKVMEPVVECLDSLQSEDNAYMGTFMPTLHLMRVQLETLKVDRNLQYAQPLVSALLGKEGSGKGFYGRFADQLKDPDILIATALHPHYTMSIVRHFTPDLAVDIKDRIVREVKDIIGTDVKREPEERKGCVDKFHLLLYSSTSPEVRCQDEVEMSILKILDDWKREMVDIPLSSSLFPAHYRDAWLDLFKRYNTPLPTSAAVDRLFSTAEEILQAKRSSLTNLNLEQLVFVRGNMHLLDYTEVQEQLKEEVDL